MLNLNPQTANVQTLDGRFISTLSLLEMAVLDFYHTHGRKYGVSVVIINQADATELAEARSATDTDTILRRADSRIAANAGQVTESPWSQRKH